MLVANLAALTFSHASTAAAWFFQDRRTVGWDPLSLWQPDGMGRESRRYHSVHHVRLVDRCHDRSLPWRLAQPASSLAHLLRQSPAHCAMARLTKPSKSPSATRRAIWPRSSPPACMEFRAHQDSGEIPGETIEASKRALERTEAIVHAELKRGLGRTGHHRFRPPRSSDCLERWSAF